MSGWEDHLQEYRQADTCRRREEEQLRQADCRSPLRDKYPSLRAELSDRPSVQERVFAEQRDDMAEYEGEDRHGMEREEGRTRAAFHLHETQERGHLQRLEVLRCREQQRSEVQRGRRLSEERMTDTERRRLEEQSRQESCASPIRDHYPSLRCELSHVPDAQRRFFAEQQADVREEEAQARVHDEKVEANRRGAWALHETQERSQIEFHSRLNTSVDQRIDEMRPPSPTKMY